MKPKYVTTLTAATIALTCISAQAALIFYEGFDYTPGANALGGAVNPGTNQSWSDDANDLDVYADSLTYGSLLTSGGKAGRDNGANVSNNINIPVGTPTTGVYWISFLLQQTTTADYQGGSMVIKDQYNNSFISAGRGTSGDTYYFFKSGGSYSYFSTGGKTFSESVTRSTNPEFLVWKYDFGATTDNEDNTITAYYNPTPGAPENSLTPLKVFNNADHGVNNGVMKMENLLLDISNRYSGSILFDEIRIGTTYEDVAPVPEPSNWALLLLSSAGLLALRRRNR